MDKSELVPWMAGIMDKRRCLIWKEALNLR